MTWQSFFDLSTMGHRHIVAVYAGVWLLQGGYLVWHPYFRQRLQILRSIRQTRYPQRLL